jgi:hypothetical protein
MTDSWTYGTLSTDGIKLEWEDNKMLASVKDPPHLEKPTLTPTARTVSFSPQAQYPVDNSLQEVAAGNGAPRYVPLNQAGEQPSKHTHHAHELLFLLWGTLVIAFLLGS